MTALQTVLLAAGRSSRLGEPKGLVMVDDGAGGSLPWVQRQIEAIRAALGGGGRVVLVLGHDRQSYLEALPHLDQLAHVTVNPDPDRGPFSSLQQGLAQVASGEPAFVLPIDVPAASPDVWVALQGALAGQIQAAVPTLEGRGGHPVLLAGSLLRDLLARPPGSRLDAELGQLGAAGRVARVAVTDPLVRLNLNAPEDWRKLDASLWTRLRGPTA